MRIKNIDLGKTDNNIVLSSEVEFKGQKPERMWFETDLKIEPLLSSDYSPFLAAVLLPCMKIGENITIEGPVSPQLLKNAEKIMDLVEGWDVGMKRVNVIAPSPQSSPKGRGSTDFSLSSRERARVRGSVGSFFSAGVDSFYTYLKHKNKPDKIANLILVHGFDIPLSNTDFFEEIKQTVEKIAKEEKVNAIFVRTNAGEIIEKHLIWDFAHGGALAAVGLFLGQGLSKIYIPAGLRKDEIFPYGTRPDLDRLWSTETTEFVHDGAEYNRLGKVLNSISKSNLALKYLRVCSQNIKGKYNCGKCYKCLQTMIELVCAGKLGKAKAFPNLDLEAVKNMYYDYDLKYNLQGEANLEILKRENREPELQEAIEESLKRSRKFSLKRKIISSVANWDKHYNNRRIYLSVIRMNKNQDRNLLYKTLMKLGVLK